MDIDNGIDGRLPYRVGYPTLPTLPIITEEAEVSIDNGDQFWKEIFKILSDLNIPLYLNGLFYCYHEGQRQREEVTLMVRSRYEEGCHVRWRQAVKAIHAYLRQRNLPYAIEICDERVTWGRYEIDPVDSANKDMRNAVDELRAILRKEITGHSWVAVDILRSYSPVRGLYHPAFVISASDSDSDLWWNATLPSIREKFAGTKHDFDVVLLHLEKLSRPCSDYYALPDQNMELEFFSEPREMGTSCGLRGVKHSGTWGGKVILLKDGKRMELGLTNSHVLLDGLLQPETAGGERASFEGHKGPFPPGTFNEDHMVVSPSDRDAKAASENLETKIAENNKKLREFYEISTFKNLTQYQTNKQTEGQSRAIGLAASQRIAQDSERDIGLVYAASGFTKRGFKPAPDRPWDNWALDWALFEVNATHCHGNAQGLLQWDPVEPSEQYKVTKTGRTSGKSECLVSGFDSMITIEGHESQPNSKTSNIISDDLSKAYQGGFVTHAVMHKGERRIAAGLQKEEPLDLFNQSEVQLKVIGYDPALLEGDSGSLFLHHEGSTSKVLGLGFATNTGTGVSYMMPAELVVQSIEEVTGGKVQGFVDY